ncbi:MAG: TolC family protein [Verrucomicrobia bacterium]|nr:MAG: TolC family protein [Verrucomicrobiota bacterium]
MLVSHWGFSMKHFVWAVFLGIFCCSMSSGQPTLTRDEAVQLALANNPELRASGARVDAAVGRAYQAKQWSNPELELSAEDWPVSNGRGFSDAKQTIGVVQTLPYPGKKLLDGQIGGAGVKLSEAELALRRTEIVRDVKAGFARVLAAERLVEVSAELVAVAESFAAVARKRVDAGATAYHEQLRAEVQLEQVRTDLADFQRELVTVQQSFAALLGQPKPGAVKLAGVLVETAQAELLEGTAGAQLATHPSLSVAQANLERAQLESRRARLEPYPDVKAGVSGGRMGERDQSIIQLGFALPLPILDRGQGRQQAARANVNVAEAELQAVQQQLQREWANALKRYRTAAEQVASYRERILPKANAALRLVQTGFEQGKFNFIDLVDTQRTTAEARRAYQQKLLELNITQVQLEALLQP